MIDKNLVIQVLKDAELKSGDIIFIHANLALFGRIKNVSSNNELYKFWLDIFTEYLGHDGTLALPAFTYSFNSIDNSGHFDVRELPKFSGMAHYAIENNLDYERSLDPMLSVICFGKYAEEITKEVDSNCFGSDSVWARLLSKNAKLVNLNLDSASTFLHYVERLNQVDYRNDIKMVGSIKGLNRISTKREISYYGRINRASSYSKENFYDYHELVTKVGINKRFTLGRGVINVSKFSEIAEFTSHHLKQNANFLINGD